VGAKLVMLQVLKALEAAQKEPKAPLSDMFTDGKTAAANNNIACMLCNLPSIWAMSQCRFAGELAKRHPQ